MSKSPGSLIPLFKIKVEEKGRIKDIKEIIVRIEGLPTCLYGQIVIMGDGIEGIIMGYDEEEVMVLALGDPTKLKMGKEVVGVSEPFKIPVGEGLIGRMVDALGAPCDNAGEIVANDYLPVFRDSPPITHRAAINEFFPTGTKIVDMLIPLAKGQRQLILGDRMTGKTVVALDAILNQKGKGTICIYCCIGKSMSNLEKAAAAFHEGGALAYTVIVAATDNAPVGEQYIVPFSASSIADFFASHGKDVLVVFDDLTKHAWAYRQLSLLLERPPGREAYPGDIFYVQTQLMERAGRFNKDHGGGSITFLGIAETLQNDLTGYIPSNLSSMCDGQICLSSTVFAEGFRPAIDIGVSLSIVGGKTQPDILKVLARGLRADYAQYSEIVKLSKLSSGLSDDAERIVKKGEIIRKVFQQGEYHPVSIAEGIVLLYAVDKNLLLEFSEAQQTKFCKEIFAFAMKESPGLIEAILVASTMTPDIENGLQNLFAKYRATLDKAEVKPSK
ncbi:MAG: F0F1 ATP synthase subunit alpha [Lentisphaerae bacterium]|nr:F0F1 ATP synthase subunit alpha [Lentisphaerota bacterium]